MKKLSLLIAAAAALLLTACSRSAFEVSSPDGHLRAEVRLNDGSLQWRLSHDTTTVLDWSAIGIDILRGETAVAPDFGQLKAKKSARNLTHQPAVYVKRNRIVENCNVLTLSCGEYDVEWRLFDDGAAYRIVVNKSEQPTIVNDEQVEFRFAGDYEALIPYENDRRGGEKYCFSMESYYDQQRLSEMYEDSLSASPLCVTLPDGKRAVLAETGLVSFPGLFLKKGEGNSLAGEHPCVVKEEKVGGWIDYNLVPVSRYDYIARWDDHAEHALPWRIVGVYTEDRQILNSDLVWLLSPETKTEHDGLFPDLFNWVVKGQSVWDWWNDWNLEGVDFETGINNRTYEYYADFASRYHIPYLIVDDGWSTHASLMDVKEDFDPKALCEYCGKKDVSVILWASYRALMSDLEGQMEHYADMGVRGFKVDFFDRDDQQIIIDIERMAECAARHHLILDLHGFKPTGIQREWPNVVSFEGVKGLENFKWEPKVGDRTLHDHPRNVIESTFLRGYAGPMDYTPGSMCNATYDTFKTSNHRPMSIGTRCNQMAMFVCMEAPFQMLADSPTEYEKNEECTALLTSIPTTFDETLVVDAKLGEYILTARRKGDIWYVGALSNHAVDLEVPLAFLSDGLYHCTLFASQPNAQSATDYQVKKTDLSSTEILPLPLGYADGAVAIIQPAE